MGVFAHITPHRPLTLAPLPPPWATNPFILRSRDMYIHIHTFHYLKQCSIYVPFHLSGKFHTCNLSQLRHCSMHSIIQNFEQGFPLLCSPIPSNMASKICVWCPSCTILDSKQNSNHKTLTSKFPRLVCHASTNASHEASFTCSYIFNEYSTSYLNTQMITSNLV